MNILWHGTCIVLLGLAGISGLCEGFPEHILITALSALQATQEKVAALMQAADAKGSRRTSAGGGKGSSASPAKTAAQGGGWRVSTIHSMRHALQNMEHLLL